MENFTLRLKVLMARGALTNADTATLFDRERRTVSSWVNDGRQPTGARAEEAFDKLRQLERAVEAGYGFPIPQRLSKRDRAAYVRSLGAKLERNRVPEAGSPTKRVVRRVRNKT